MSTVISSRAPLALLRRRAVSGLELAGELLHRLHHLRGAVLNLDYHLAGLVGQVHPLLGLLAAAGYAGS